MDTCRGEHTGGACVGTVDIDFEEAAVLFCAAGGTAEDFDLLLVCRFLREWERK